MTVQNGVYIGELGRLWGKLRYQPALDGLRAIAVFGVVAVHVGVPFLPGAGMGVEIFFALSGYLITRLLVQEEAERGRIDLTAFYMRRVLRLAPALVAVTVFATLVDAAQKGQPGDALFTAAMALTYLMNFNRAFEWGAQGYLGHTWSLSMEEQFYLVWPVAMILATASKRVPLLIAAIAAEVAWKLWLLAQGAGIERVYNGFDTHAEVLLIGCLAALVEPHLSAGVRRGLARQLWVPAALLVADFLFMQAGTPVGQTAGMLLVGFSTVWVVIGLPDNRMLTELLSIRPLVFLGRISYGIYLWHYPILMAGHHAGLPMWGVLNPVLAVIAATASFYLIERPFLRLKHRFQVRHSDRETADYPAAVPAR